MQISYKEWIKNLTEDEVEQIEDKMIDCDLVEQCLKMGYASEEDVAWGYFRDREPLYAELREINGYNVITKGEEDFDKSLVYDDKEEAMKKILTFENTLYPSIENQIETFQNELGDYCGRVDVIAKQEFNNGGNFYSFNIQLDDMLFEDGVFSLNADEIIRDIKVFDSLECTLKNEYGIKILSIEKTRDNFERYYELELKKDDNYITTEIHIPCWTQGSPKKIVSFVNDLDIDAILEEFKELEG